MKNSIDEAYEFYKKHIYVQEKFDLLKEHNLKIAGSVSSVTWELFASIVTGRKGNGVTGADLVGWEVKSATTKGSYEYQYHLNTGEEKLKEDCVVNHLFFSYSQTYTDVEVMVMHGEQLTEYFNEWLPLYRANYDITSPSKKRRQRFRKSIPKGYITKNGKLILKIVNTKLVYRADSEFFDFIKA